MRRVLIVSHTYVDPATRGKLVALAARDLDVTVGVPQRWRDPALGRPIEVTWERLNGVEVFPVPVRGAGDVERVRFARRELAALLRDKRPELVQIEEEPTTAVAHQVVKVARKLAIPAVLFTWENVDRRPPLLRRWRRRRTLRRLRGALAGSEAAAALVRRDAPDLPVAVIPQLGVHVPPAGRPEHTLHEGLAIGYVGRLVPAKGLDTLLEALAANRGSAWHLTVVGDGPDRERLERLASALRLAARVRWAGALPPEQVPLLWPDLDVLVLPARASATWTEQSGHVLAEAMAHEVAVVGSDTGVIPEVIGDAGLIVPAGDCGALAAALRSLEDAAVRRPLAQAARARAMKHYSDDAVAERTLNFWRSLLETEHRAGSSS